jgi:signal transduction histidine kinase
MRPADIDPTVDAESEDERIETFEQGRIERFDTVHETKSGTRLPVEINATLIPYRGETAILSTARDVSDRVERERELERRNDRLEELASVVSHDLRNPLNVATGRIAWAREECDSPHIDDAAAALERMDGLIDDLLALAGHGQRDIDPTSLDMESFVGRCWANVATDDATLDVRVEGTVRADESRLGQAFENLFRNAVEHAADERDGVTITVGSLPDGFYVADDGPGVPESDRERIFEAGYSTNRNGTGLGLAIVRDAVEAHGWALAVTESETGGARFEITGVQALSSSSP